MTNRLEEISAESAVLNPKLYVGKKGDLDVSALIHLLSGTRGGARYHNSMFDEKAHFKLLPSAERFDETAAPPVTALKFNRATLSRRRLMSLFGARRRATAAAPANLLGGRNEIVIIFITG
ncbi:hypothetical protein EVAR_48107_1 [Eumeta japonica]|uniref:Uncharacterized protein n=1 Tax=Eumeta variegata TaxID=151549 RepID=A0A4C1XK98_EUMVA|nr:hypothetical protein EVAR_48107_1 [Eumeta japonica]